MPRGLSAGTLTALQQGRVLPAIFLYGSFLDGDVRVWSGMGNIAWNGFTWTGLGQPGGECLGSISAITEDSQLQAAGLTISLSGVDPTMLTHALSAVQQGRPCQIYVNLFDDALNVIGSIFAFGGLLDQPTIEEGADKCTISIAVENRLADLQRAQYRRWTAQDQRIRLPYDTGFNFVNQLISYFATWGGS